MKNRFGLIGISAEQYTEQVRPMNVDVTFQDGGSTAVIDIEGFIGRDLLREFITGEKSKNTAENLKDEIRSFEADKIIVNIHSPGGDLSEGLVIKDLLQAKNAEVITNLQGFSASAATVIHQAGDTRRMPENSSFMLVHRAMMGVMGFFNQNSFAAFNDDLAVIDAEMVKLYAKRSNASEQEIKALMDAGEGYGKWINAETALDMGFVDEVYDPGDDGDVDIDRMESKKQTARAIAAAQPHISNELKELFGTTRNGSSASFEFDSDAQENEKQESIAAEEAHGKKVKNEIFKQTHEV